MSEQDIKLLIDGFNTKLDQCHVKLNNGHSKNTWMARGIWALTLSIIGLIFTAVFYMGSLDRTVELLEKNMIESNEWDRNDKMTWDAYNKAYFDKDTRFQTRGVPAPKI